MLEVEDLELIQGTFKLTIQQMKVTNNEYLVILGPSGAGKTTLLECIAGLRKPQKGKILLDNENITQKPVEKRNISLVPQESALFPHMTVKQNIEYGLKAKGVPREVRKKKTQEIAKRLAIYDKLDRYPVTLSGGEKQRVALARALAVEPKLLLLDEPIASLDPPLRKEIRRELKQLKKEYAIPFIHVTHSQSEALALADRIMILINGEIAEEGKPIQIYYKPRKAFTAKFMGIENIYRARKISEKEEYSVLEINGVKILAKGKFPKETLIGIRPYEIEITKENSANKNVYQGTIEEIVIEGYTAIITVNINGLKIKTTTPITKQIQTNLKPGDKTIIKINPTAIIQLEKVKNRESSQQNQ